MGYTEDFYSNPDLDDGFGSKAGGRLNPHRGLDFPKALGTAVPALQGGVVVIQEWHDGLGNIVEIRQDDGRYAGYRHMRSTGGPWVRVGQRVETGQKIGEVSDTGEWAAGYHLCHTNGSEQGAVYGYASRVSDPWPWIKHYLFGGPRPGGSAGDGFERAPGGEPGAPMWPVGERMERLQRALDGRTKFGEPSRYLGKIDGKGGELTAKGIQLTLNISKMNGIEPFVESPLDGALGVNNAYGVQHYGKAYGGYDGSVDGDPLANSWDAMIRALELP